MAAPRGIDGRRSIKRESARAVGCTNCPQIDKQSSAGAKIFFVMSNGSRTSNGAQSKSYAEERGVALMGDIPFGVSYYSADVFARAGRIRARLVRRRAARADL